MLWADAASTVSRLCRLDDDATSSANSAFGSISSPPAQKVGPSALVYAEPTWRSVELLTSTNYSSYRKFGRNAGIPLLELSYADAPADKITVTLVWVGLLLISLRKT